MLQLHRAPSSVVFVKCLKKKKKKKYDILLSEISWPPFPSFELDLSLVPTLLRCDSIPSNFSSM